MCFFTCDSSWKANTILTYDWLGEIRFLPVTGSKIDFSVIGCKWCIRFYLWLVMKGESDFTCGWSLKMNQILPVTGRDLKGNQTLPVVGRERGIRFYLRLVVKEESDFTTCGWSRN